MGSWGPIPPTPTPTHTHKEGTPMKRYHFTYFSTFEPRTARARSLKRIADRKEKEDPDGAFWLDVDPEDADAYTQVVVNASEMLNYMIGWSFQGALRGLAARRLKLTEEEEYAS